MDPNFTFNDFRRVAHRYGEKRNYEEAGLVVSAAYFKVAGFTKITEAESQQSSEFVFPTNTPEYLEQELRTLENAAKESSLETASSEEKIVQEMCLYVDNLLEQASEDMSARRRKTIEEYESLRPKDDNSPLTEAAARWHSSKRPIGTPEITTEVLRRRANQRLDDLIEAYAPPITQERMKEARARIDAWRASMSEVLGI